MTYKEIEKIRDFIERLKYIQYYKGMRAYVAELNGYWGKELNISLRVNTVLSPDSYTSDACDWDKNKIRNFLERKIDEDVKAVEICAVLDLIDEGKSLNNDPQKMEEYVAKVYLSYSNEIPFDNIIKTIATQYGVPSVKVYTVNKTVIESVLTQLKRYITILCSDTKEADKSMSQQTININTAANANSSVNVNVDIDLAIEIAQKQAEDAGLSDEQYSQVLKKLEELESIAKSKESKGKRWQKVKEIMKWLVEQGIQVASIVVPVLASSIL